MPLDFVATYMPAFTELSATDVADCRDRLKAYAEIQWPDLDMSPNTVMGDLILTPQAYQMTAIETGLDHFMSDLNLENVANNVIYNCDFVNGYLGNFGANENIAQQASGAIRLVFDTEKTYTLDRGIQFSIGNYIFSLYLPNNGPYYIYPPGTALPDGINATNLKDSGEGTWFADVPVVGYAIIDEDLEAAEVDEEEEDEDEDEEEEEDEEEDEEEELEDENQILTGEEVLISSHSITELGSAAALFDFNMGTSELTFAQRAAKTRETIYSASLNTRNGAIRYLKDVCSFVQDVSAVRNGDREMLRDFLGNEFGVSQGRLDLYVRSPNYQFTETQSVKLYLNADESAYEGDFHYVGCPYYIESVRHANSDSDNLPHHFVSTNEIGLGAIASYTRYEKLKLVVQNQTENFSSIFAPTLGEDGRYYSYFTVTYQTDPMFPAIAATMENRDHRPVNTDILVRGFIPVIIRKFNVLYVRKAGVVPDLDRSYRRIKEYLDSLSTTNVFTEANIAQIMKEEGADYMSKIDIYAYVQWSIGKYTSDLNGNLVETKDNTYIRSGAGMRIKYPNDNIDLKAGDMYACSLRNLRFYILEGSITFTEVREV